MPQKAETAATAAAAKLFDEGIQNVAVGPVLFFRARRPFDAIIPGVPSSPMFTVQPSRAGDHLELAVHRADVGVCIDAHNPHLIGPGTSVGEPLNLIPKYPHLPPDRLRNRPDGEISIEILPDLNEFDEVRTIRARGVHRPVTEVKAIAANTSHLGISFLL
jgi:hypothetical protein